MKAKTIKRALSAKFEELLASIEDATVREAVQKNTIITGGCIASMLLKEPVNDYDLYFRNEATALAVANYYVDRFNVNPPQEVASGVLPVKITVVSEAGRVKTVVKSAGIAGETQGEKKYDYFERRETGQGEEYIDQQMKALDEKPASTIDEQKPDYRPVFLSANAITLSGKVQIIIRFFGEPQDIHMNYDFVHCMSYWCSWDDTLVLHPGALEALLAKELRYCGSKYPLCSIIRTRKFIARGWTINAGQYLKMAMQLNDLDLKNLDVLEDQLTGVDAAYFMQLIGALRDVDSEKINAAYISTIIDRIF